MRFFSDNAASVHPQVMAAMAAANHIDTAYDGDTLSQSLDRAFSDLFDTPVSALWTLTGTAANCLGLAAICPPEGAIICHRDAHIEVDEAGAPGFFTHGAKLILLDGDGGKLHPDTLRAACARIRPDVHQVQPAALSITNATESGLAYRSGDIADLVAAARALGLRVQIDGARLANALAFTGESPAALARSGIDALSFGFVKNGGMSAEALILFDPALGDRARRLRKRAGQLQSKGRFLAAQLLAMLKDDLWLTNARAANAAAQAIAAAAPDRLLHPVEANEIFLRLSVAEAADLRAQGFDFYDWGVADHGWGAARLVTSWDQRAEDVTRLAAALAALAPVDLRQPG